MKLERDWQKEFIKELTNRMPRAIVIKPDSGYTNGIPDRVILCGDKWAAVEFKAHRGAKFQPCQEWYIKNMAYMSYAKAVYPDNQMEVLDEIQELFGL